MERYAEVGRVVVISYGPYAGELAIIVEIIDHNRALVEGKNVPRHATSFKRASLTDTVIKIPRAIGSAKLQNKIKDIQVEFAKTGWGKKMDRYKKRAALSDFDRYKVRVAKKKVMVFNQANGSCWCRHEKVGQRINHTVN